MLVHTRQPGSRCGLAHALDLLKPCPLLTALAGLLSTFYDGAQCSVLEPCLLTPQNCSKCGIIIETISGRQKWALKF